MTITGPTEIQRGDTPSFVFAWPAAAITPSDVWRFQISKVPNWVGRSDDDLLFDIDPTVTTLGDGSQEITAGPLTSEESAALPGRCFFGLRLTNDDNGSDPVWEGEIRMTTSPVAPGAAGT